MENASKALLMAASVLIGMIILTMGVYLYTTIGAYVRESQEQIERETINKFNVQFYNYLSEENEIFSFQEIVTIANVAYENNYKYELPTTKDSAEIVKKYNGKNNYVQVVLKGYMLNETDVTNNSINLELYVGDQDSLREVLKNNYASKYICTGVETGPESKKVYKIEFRKIEN